MNEINNIIESNKSQVQDNRNKYLEIAEKLGTGTLKPRPPSKRELYKIRCQEKTKLTIAMVYRFLLKLHKKHGFVFMAQTKMAKKMGLGLTTIKEALIALDKAGLWLKGHIYREGYYERKMICCYFPGKFFSGTRVKYYITACKEMCKIAHDLWKRDVSAHLVQAVKDALALLAEKKRTWFNNMRRFNKRRRC